jgi:ribosomal protein S18 acetylase RimI-like enzyme
MPTLKRVLLWIVPPLYLQQGTASAWFIQPPQIRSDWEQLSNVVANGCMQPEAPKAIPTATNCSGDSLTIFQDWNLMLQTSISARQIYSQFVRNAKKMQGMKYAILIAREVLGGPVVGMVELGVVSVGPDVQKKKRVMIGVLSVDYKYRNRGVASALVKQCESIAVRQWNETTIHAQVELSNRNAYSFFTKNGFSWIGSSNETTYDWVLVRRNNRQIEAVPHVLFAKAIDIKDNTTTLSQL